jgi:hypothetical protein
MTRSVRQKTERTGQTPPIVPPSAIAQRAFELYAARGGAHGHDVDDWLRAERELTQGAAPARPRRTRKLPANG